MTGRQQGTATFTAVNALKEMLHLCLYTLRHFARLPLLLNTPLSSPQLQQLSRGCDVYVIIFFCPQSRATLELASLLRPEDCSLCLCLFFFFLSNSQKWWERAKGRVSLNTPPSILTEEPGRKTTASRRLQSEGIRMKEGMKTLKHPKKKKKKQEKFCDNT